MLHVHIYTRSGMLVLNLKIIRNIKIAFDVLRQTERSLIFPSMLAQGFTEIVGIENVLILARKWKLRE